MTQLATARSASLQHAIGDHARKLEPLVGCLAIGILLELLPLGWRVWHSREGAQSYSLWKGDKQYHFRARGRPLDSLTVLDSYQNGNVIDTLKSRVDVLRFIRDRIAES